MFGGVEHRGRHGGELATGGGWISVTALAASRDLPVRFRLAPATGQAYRHDQMTLCGDRDRVAPSR
ncbi:MAG: hypothetical protein R6U94_14040 [Nitriliruptoraceae bacterium]